MPSEFFALIFLRSYVYYLEHDVKLISYITKEFYIRHCAHIPVFDPLLSKENGISKQLNRKWLKINKRKGYLL